MVNQNIFPIELKRWTIDSSVLLLIPYFGFIYGVDRLMISEPRGDFNQLLMQVKYNFQVFWSFVD